MSIIIYTIHFVLYKKDGFIFLKVTKNNQTFIYMFLACCKYRYHLRNTRFLSNTSPTAVLNKMKVLYEKLQH